jgi:hypothetical protein
VAVTTRAAVEAAAAAVEVAVVAVVYLQKKIQSVTHR